MSSYTFLNNRGVIAISGDDCVDFLQGIVSNDVSKVTDESAGYGAFLTPQGKYLYDFFMIRRGETLFLETERDRIDGFIKRLTLYTLRARVTLEDASEDVRVAAIFGDGVSDVIPAKKGSTIPLGDGLFYRDPRLAEAGARAILPVNGASILTLGATETSFEDYDRHRIALGLPDGSRDLIVEKSVLLENGFDELGGVDWDKGCYMGQEVTARTKHRGLVKKRLVPVAIDGVPPEAGTPVLAGEKNAGEIRSTAGAMGLALLKLDYLKGSDPLIAGDAILSPEKPSWATF